MKWLALIISALIAFYFYIKSIIDSISVKFSLENLSDINLSNLNLRDLGSGFIKLRIKLIIKFFSLFNINVKDFKIDIYYNGGSTGSPRVLIAKSSEDVIENNKTLTLIKNVDNIVYHTFDLQNYPALIELAYKVKNNLPFTIDYNISLKIFGITIKTNNSYASTSSAQVNN